MMDGAESGEVGLVERMIDTEDGIRLVAPADGSERPDFIFDVEIAVDLTGDVEVLMRRL